MHIMTDELDLLVVLSILGAVEVSQLAGPILPHEHTLMDFTREQYLLPVGWTGSLMPLSMENLGKIKRYPQAVHYIICSTYISNELMNHM